MRTFLIIFCDLLEQAEAWRAAPSRSASIAHAVVHIRAGPPHLVYPAAIAGRHGAEAHVPERKVRGRRLLEAGE